ncbi:MAG TPA: NUDIX domain-containing protein [Allosphingosinicella sp.]
MRNVSAGILLYRRVEGGIEVLLIRPGGPFWRGRDEGAWMIPKGGIDAGETALEAAIREFEEEMGSAPAGTPVPLCTVRQKGGKWVEAFALEGEFDPAALSSNSFTLEYPPRSGQYRDFPEVEEARWFGLEEARAKMLASQLPILDALAERLSRRTDAGTGGAGSADTGSPP